MGKEVGAPWIRHYLKEQKIRNKTSIPLHIYLFQLKKKPANISKLIVLESYGDHNQH